MYGNLLDFLLIGVDYTLYGLFIWKQLAAVLNLVQRQDALLPSSVWQVEYVLPGVGRALRARPID